MIINYSRISLKNINFNIYMNFPNVRILLIHRTKDCIYITLSFTHPTSNTRKRCEICSKLTIKTIVKLLPLLLNLNIFLTFFNFFKCNKKWQKTIRFLNNDIWSGSVKFSVMSIRVIGSKHVNWSSDWILKTAVARNC